VINDNITQSIANAYKSMYEAKEVKRESWVPKQIADEDVADFMGAAAAAAKDGKKDFKFGDKTYKVTMKKDTVDAITKEESVKEKDQIEVCEKCGKVHEGSCGSNEKKEVEEVAEPEAKGEKDFKDMHTKNTEKSGAEDDGTVKA